MSWTNRLYNVLRPGRHARELRREMDFHLAELTDNLVAGGMSEADATREARRRFGNRTLQEERTREVDAFQWLEGIFTDLRYAARALRASPAFAAVAILSLALGIGANTAIFSLTNALLLRPLPVSHPEELLMVTPGGSDTPYFTNPLWEQLRAQDHLFAGAFAYGTTGFDLSEGGVARRVPAAWVSGEIFTVLGVKPLAGRLLERGDDVRACAGAVAVSAGFAEREYGGAAQAVGRRVSLDGHRLEIVGVTDPEFFGIKVGRSADVYVPQCAQTIFYGPDVLDARSRWYLQVLVRPRPELSGAQLRAGLALAAPAIYAATVPPKWAIHDQEEYRSRTLGVAPAATGFSDLRADYRPALMTLMIVVGVVLLIACANIANLLLARTAARQRELALRLAIGAGRWRIARQLLTESLLVTVLGAALGVCFAMWASHLLVAFVASGNDGVWLDLTIDARVLGFTTAVALVTAVLFSLVPAWFATRVEPQGALKSGGRGLTDAGARNRFGRSLVVAQIALSLGLVAASGLLLGSFRKIVTLDPGFRREGVLVARMNFGKAGVKGEALGVVNREILERLRALPGVTSASASMITPIGDMSWNDVVQVPGRVPAGMQDSIAYFNQVSDGYFETLGTRLISGRDLSASDVAGAPKVAVVNESMALRFFGSASPLGRTFTVQVGDGSGPPIQVVGVVRDAKYQQLTEVTQPTAYVPMGQGEELSEVNFELRAPVDPETLVPAVRAVAADVNPAISLVMGTLEAQVARSLARPRLLAALSGFFGALALALAVIGLYGTMSYSVTRRRREIGVRMAFGALNRQVLGMLLGEAGRLIGWGLAAGILLSLAGTRLVRSFLFGVTATEPAIFAASVALLAVVALIAALVPAWRAARLDPLAALRED